VDPCLQNPVQLPRRIIPAAQSPSVSVVSDTTVTGCVANAVASIARSRHLLKFFSSSCIYTCTIPHLFLFCTFVTVQRSWSFFTYLLNIWEFVYFVCGLSPPKRRVVRWPNFAHRRVTTMCRTCAGFYVYRGRRYKNNDIFYKTCACRPSPAGLCITINSTGLTAAWADTLTLLAKGQSITSHGLLSLWSQASHAAANVGRCKACAVNSTGLGSVALAGNGLWHYNNIL